MGYYLLDHHVNRNGGLVPWYTTRRATVSAIVIHTPQTLEDFAPPYDEAERVAQYGATTTRASWHDTVDADSIIPMLPPEFTAWHVRGYNSETIGMEIGAKATSWNSAPEAWVTGVLTNAARRAREHADQFDIPVRFITRTQLDAGERGFTSHAQLDPTRRSDPGADFPWDRFLELVEGVEMVDRKTTLDDGAESLELVFAKAREVGAFSEHTQPGTIVTPDQFAAYLDRMGLLEWRPWTKKQIAKAIAAGAVGGATVAEVLEAIANRLSG